MEITPLSLLRLHQRTGEENWSDCRSTVSAGTMCFSSQLWNTGQLYTLHWGAWGFVGVCPTSQHLFCWTGDRIQPCPSCYSVGGTLQVCITGAEAWITLLEVSHTYMQIFTVWIKHYREKAITDFFLNGKIGKISLQQSYFSWMSVKTTDTHTYPAPILPVYADHRLCIPGPYLWYEDTRTSPDCGAYVDSQPPAPHHHQWS